MVKEFFKGAFAPNSAFNIPRTPIEQLAMASSERDSGQDNLRYLQKQENCSYCLLDYRDDLTKLANKRYFNIWLEQVWKRLALEQVPLSLILIEIDYFKIYNNSRPDEAGDDCLQQVAKVISAWVQPPDGLAARCGSEKFALIIPQTKADNAVKIGEKIRKNVKKLALYHDSQIDGLPDRVVTVSLGVGMTIPQIEVSPSLLMQAAEEALYQSQRKGRDRTEVKCIVAGS
ncbi:diguanylate cyclase [Microseira wollei]|uniref:GGDEF domain protein n=1 Tax=Microseira wollei NIES-4236 TaxID=2530354 RepID=A0AAV3XKC8_9CYAN|nr:diguanylate cyclase [Microseira wollei]GET42043.1 GGDEF domain protein [Microseira wollei NIES-4236]